MPSLSKFACAFTLQEGKAKLLEIRDVCAPNCPGPFFLVRTLEFDALEQFTSDLMNEINLQQEPFHDLLDLRNYLKFSGEVLTGKSFLSGPKWQVSRIQTIPLPAKDMLDYIMHENW